jgi:pentatricopeptide repeat protein
MFRRVALTHRLHLDLSVLTVGVNRSRAPCPTACNRWHTSAVSQSKRHPLSTGETEQVFIHPSRERPKYVSQAHQRPVSRREATLPQLISVVDTLLSSTTSKKRVLKRIRSSPYLSAAFLDHEKVRKIAEAFASTRSPRQSFRILNLAHELGCSLQQNAFECVCYHLANMKDWRAVLSAVSLGKRHTRRTTVRLLNWRVRALAETQHYALLQGVLDEFRENIIKPTRRTFHLILSAHIQNRSLSMAKQCLQAMAEAGFPVDASTHAIVATHYRSLGADSQVQSRSLEALPGLRSTTATAVVNSLMQLRIDTHDIPGTMRLLSLFNQRHVGVIFDVMSVGNDGVVEREGAMRSTLMSLDGLDSIRGNLIPNAATFALFISYLARHSNFSGALQILQSMMTTGVEPTPGLVSSVLHVLFSAERGDLAVRLVARMCDTKQAPLMMFRPLLSSSCAWDEPLPWMPSGIPPTIRVFNALLRGVLTIYGLNSASVVLRIMRATNLKPNVATLEIIIAHLGKTERTDPPVLIRLLRNLLSPTLRPTLKHLHIILSCVLRHEKYLLYGRGWDSTAAMFSPRHREPRRRYPENRISGVADSFHPMAGIELPLGLTLRPIAVSLLQSLSARRIMSDMATTGLRIQHDGRVKSDTESAREVFNVLLIRGMHPNEYHFSALMEGLAQSGDIEGAVDVMKSAKRVGVVPNVVMFTILIVGHGRQGNPDLAIRVFEEMVSAGIKPDVPAIDAVSGAFFAVGAYAMAKGVLISLWPHIQPFPRELRGASLKVLACNFRLLHHKHTVDRKPPAKRERILLLWKLRRLRKAWGRLGIKTRSSTRISARTRDLSGKNVMR